MGLWLIGTKSYFHFTFSSKKTFPILHTPNLTIAPPPQSAENPKIYCLQRCHLYSVCAIPKEMSLQNIFEKFEKGEFFTVLFFTLCSMCSFLFRVTRIVSGDAARLILLLVSTQETEPSLTSFKFRRFF